MRLVVLLLRLLNVSVRRPPVRRPPVRRRRVETADGRALVPAGRVIALVTVTLVVCALLDADTLVDTVAQEPYGASRSIELALVQPFKTVSHWTGLDLPHRWIGDLEPSGGAPALATPAAPAPRRGLALPPATPAGGPTPATAITVPAPRVPNPQQPLRVWMAGDSMMGEVAQSFAAAEAGAKDMTVSSSVQIGTGLGRPDIYNWPVAIAREVAAANPDVVVVIFGANDDQDMMLNGKRVVLGTQAWATEYARRVNAVMQAVASPDRTLIWLELPPTARPKINQADAVIDRAVAASAAVYPGVELVNLGPPLAPGGSYAQYLTGPSGQTVEVRDSDGVHLTLAGAARVTPLIMAAIRREWRVS